MIAGHFLQLPEASTPYGSHLPVLGRALDTISKGPVLELGMGTCSTPMLHDACDMQGRELWSYDQNPNWMIKFEDYRRPWHKVESVASYDQVPVQEQLWAVALVDHGPAERRNVEIRRLREFCMLVVVHDVEPKHGNAYHYIDTFPLYRFRWTTRPTGLPWTTVLSDYFDLERLWA